MNISISELTTSNRKKDDRKNLFDKEEKNSKPTTSVAGTIGKALAERLDELNEVSDEEELYDLLDTILPGIDEAPRKKFEYKLRTRPNFKQKFILVYNYVLEYQGLGLEKY